jgi:hypothetical protein
MAIIRTYATISLLWILAISPLYAQPLKAGSALELPYDQGKITIDGKLDDNQWQRAKKIDVNISTHPYDNITSPVKTTALVIENDEYLYIAFIAEDPDPSKIVAYLRDRDQSITDDLVGIKLDPFNNHRLAYKFLVNPLGTQLDGIDNEMTGESSYLWDGIWESAGQITEHGYQVEIAIPYRILNFSESDSRKTWAIEFIRTYPRDDRHRISNVPKNRDNSCKICQMGEITGFKQAQASKNIMLTPSIVASRFEDRNVFINNDDWHGDNSVDIGLDLRWALSPDTLVNATLNPDFSTVEADAGQLRVNTTFSLFYDEKRPFFLDNADYFTSNYNLVYTRNIGDPDYGAKLTGKAQNHTYGLFLANDSETNFILPGNLGSDMATLDEESQNMALRYRYDVNKDLSFGWISTLRHSDNYHNLVSGLDSKYMLSESDTLTGQYLLSNTQYPISLYQSVCDEDFCYEPYLRAQKDDDFSDQALKIEWDRQTEFWHFNAKYQDIGKDFRADLGYMPRADSNKLSGIVGRQFYANQDSWWSEIVTEIAYQISHNDDGQLLSKDWQLYTGVAGPMLSWFELAYTQGQSRGLREDTLSLEVDGNSELFDINELYLWAEFRPHASLFLGTSLIIGEQIDYANNRLGDLTELSPEITLNVNTHLELALIHTYSQLEADSTEVYTANLTDLRVNYQFNLRSSLKLSLVYSQLDRNQDNYQYPVSSTSNDLSTQLIYAYKVNPQTVFYLGYSDLSYENDTLGSLKQAERTAFMKLSYAWLG